uniref:SP-RING-type domain-containing protein n=1 Tax=Strongyloides venezuelensis TaxID=75913 RepID=A0A0K0G2H8_STRVS
MSNIGYPNYTYSYYVYVVQNLMTDSQAYEYLVNINYDFRSDIQNYPRPYKTILLRILPEILSNPALGSYCMQYLNQFINNSNYGANMVNQNMYSHPSNTNIPSNTNNCLHSSISSSICRSNTQTVHSISNNGYHSASGMENNPQLSRNIPTRFVGISNNPNIYLTGSASNAQRIPVTNNRSTTNQLSVVNYNVPPRNKSTIQSILDVQMAQPRLFFYDEFCVIRPWDRNYRIIYRIDKRNNKSFAFLQHTLPITITPNILQLINAKNGDVEYEVLLRSIALRNGEHQEKDSYPLDMELFIGNMNYTCLLPRVEAKYSSSDIGLRLGYPSILTQAINTFIKSNSKQNPLDLVVNIMYPVQAVRKQVISNCHFSFKIALYSKKSPENVVMDILKRPMLPKSTFHENIRKEFNREDDEVGFESMRISLQSSVTMCSIKYPFRGRHCKHLIPDDLEDYLKQNVGNEKFQCKICKCRCTPDDIFIDEYYYEILKKNPKTCKVEIFLNGEYKILETNDSDDEDYGGKILPSKGSKEPEYIILDSSDDECENAENPAPFNSTENRNESVEKQQVVDVPESEQESSKEISRENGNVVGSSNEVNATSLSNECNNIPSSNEENPVNNEPVSNTTDTIDSMSVVEATVVVNQIDIVNDEVVINRVKVTSQEVIAEEIDEVEIQVNNLSKNGGNLVEDVPMEVDEIQAQKKEISKDSVAVTNECISNKLKKWIKSNNNYSFFRKTKEYVELNKAQFRRDFHPGDIFN